MDDLLNDIADIQRADATTDPDLNDMLLHLSTTVPENAMLDNNSLPNLNQTSLSAPSTNDIAAWCKERQRKDNHNQSMYPA